MTPLRWLTPSKTIDTLLHTPLLLRLTHHRQHRKPTMDRIIRFIHSDWIIFIGTVAMIAMAVAGLGNMEIPQ